LLEERFIEAGVSRLEFGTWNEQNIISRYEQAGYNVTGAEPVMLPSGKNFTFILMGKSLR
jgi:hypothetical protein